MSPRLRNAARWLAAAVASPLGIPTLLARSRRAGGRWGIVLRYHRVIPAEEPVGYYRMGIDERLFAAQLDWLASHARVVSLEELLRWKRGGKVPGSDLVVLTFDDGYRDNATHAAPLLRARGLPATFYITSGCLRDRMPFWPETLAQILRLTRSERLEIQIGQEPLLLPLATESHRSDACRALIGRLRTRSTEAIARSMEAIARSLDVEPEVARNATPPVLSAADVRALSAAGFGIGAHTVTHPYLPAEPAETQKREIEESRRELEEAAAVPVLDFCYPGGGYDPGTRDLVRRAGYRSATTTDLGIVGGADDDYRLPRIGVGTALATGPNGRFSASLWRMEITGSMTALYRSRRRRSITVAG